MITKQNKKYSIFEKVVLIPLLFSIPALITAFFQYTGLYKTADSGLVALQSLMLIPLLLSYLLMLPIGIFIGIIGLLRAFILRQKTQEYMRLMMLSLLSISVSIMSEVYLDMAFRHACSHGC